MESIFVPPFDHLIADTMVDLLLDDIKELMAREKGDQKVLEQIKRAAENDEVISIHERDYVKKLAEKYLGKSNLEFKKEISPDVKLPQEQEKSKSTPHQTLHSPRPIERTREEPLQKNTKLMLVIGIVALIIVIAAGVGMSGMDITQDSVNPTTPKPSAPPSGLSIKTDLESYNRGDIISISGTVVPSADELINLSIENFDGETVWLEDVKIKSNDKFSTLVIAGGPGWENSGDYILKAEHGAKQESITFRFNN